VSSIRGRWPSRSDSLDWGVRLILYRDIPHNRDMNNVDLLKELRRRELPGGGWSFSGSPQVSLETTCLATFSLLAERLSAAPQVIRPLLRAQLSDGSWPSFIGDEESSWTTALAICVLNSANDSSSARERGQSWLLKTKGREGGWLWRWKFELVDREFSVRLRAGSRFSPGNGVTPRFCARRSARSAVAGRSRPC
jgi:hypothetical protein